MHTDPGHLFINAQYLFPDIPEVRSWLDEAWRLGLKNPTDRTFVAVDPQENDRVVAFSRWMIPNDNGNQERYLHLTIIRASSLSTSPFHQGSGPT
jgi:hypothetical protein